MIVALVVTLSNGSPPVTALTFQGMSQCQTYLPFVLASIKRRHHDLSAKAECVAR